ncbi:hypothetical protein D623_10003479 [Myotis brandtii]|uniref:Uncharacterized protein n=1 Tax=Myotis brandtii TaxID=109478 RepID=S7N6H1_MYOBR|nr:hypothetical protein D623_10003479 [Myotis brandtii]
MALSATYIVRTALSLSEETMMHKRSKEVPEVNSLNRHPGLIADQFLIRYLSSILVLPPFLGNM